LPTKVPHLGILQGMKEKDVPSSILHMGLEKKCAPTLPLSYFKFIE
jgi:hypothetical protein